MRGGIDEDVPKVDGGIKMKFKTFQPVSYTHLDVYKRQIVLSIFRLSIKISIFNLING